MSKRKYHKLVVERYGFKSMINVFKNFFVHYSALLIVACMALKGNFDAFGLVLISVVIHECGHIAALFVNREHAESLVLHAFGVEINTNGKSISDMKMIFIALAGPVLSLISAQVFYFVFRPLFMPNLCIGLINLLPVIPLDGGRILNSVLLKACGRKSAKLIMRLTGLTFGIFCAALGTEIFLTSEYNFSLLLLGIFILISAFCEPSLNYSSFVREKAVLGEIYLLPRSLSVKNAAELLPPDSIGAVVDSDGKISRFVTSKELYFELANQNTEIL